MSSLARERSTWRAGVPGSCDRFGIGSTNGISPKLLSLDKHDRGEPPAESVFVIHGHDLTSRTAVENMLRKHGLKAHQSRRDPRLRRLKRNIPIPIPIPILEAADHPPVNQPISPAVAPATVATTRRTRSVRGGRIMADQMADDVG